VEPATACVNLYCGLQNQLALRPYVNRLLIGDESRVSVNSAPAIPLRHAGGWHRLSGRLVEIGGKRWKRIVVGGAGWALP
jgi:hypothetical protein